jgi:hypothetical protein
MVQEVRSGRSLHTVAAEFGVSVSTVAYWVDYSRGKRIDRVVFGNLTPGRAWNRTTPEMEQRILSARRSLREESVLGEYGAEAIALALQSEPSIKKVPSRATIHRVLARHGALDGVHRQRRRAPPKGWYLPDLARGQAELDSFDFIEDLKIAQGPLVSVLTATSLHGALPDSWIMERMGAQPTLQALRERWRREGLPTYAQFDNATIFQGAHQVADTVGRISRLCLALQVIPVFAPPREPGFQNAIEGFNALWQSKVWQRHHCPDVESLVAPLKGTMIFVRRSDDNGNVHLLGRPFLVGDHWRHRLVRCEVNFIHRQIRFYALRRRDPDCQPLLTNLPYHRSHKPFQGKL